MTRDEPGNRVSLIMTPISYDVMEFVRGDKRFGKKSLNDRLKEVLEKGVEAMKAERK